MQSRTTSEIRTLHGILVPRNASLLFAAMLTSEPPRARWADGSVHVTIPSRGSSDSDDEFVVRSLSGQNLSLGELKRVVAALDDAYGFEQRSGAAVLRLFCEHSSPFALEIMAPGSVYELSKSSGGVGQHDLNRLLSRFHKEARSSLQFGSRYSGPQHYSAPMLRPHLRLPSNSAMSSLHGGQTASTLTEIAHRACEAYDVTPYEPQAMASTPSLTISGMHVDETSSVEGAAGPGSDRASLDQAPPPGSSPGRPSPAKKSKVANEKPTKSRRQPRSTLSPPSTASQSRMRRHSASAALPPQNAFARGGASPSGPNRQK